MPLGNLMDPTRLATRSRSPMYANPMRPPAPKPQPIPGIPKPTQTPNLGRTGSAFGATKHGMGVGPGVTSMLAGVNAGTATPPAAPATPPAAPAAPAPTIVKAAVPAPQVGMEPAPAPTVMRTAAPPVQAMQEAPPPRNPYDPTAANNDLNARWTDMADGKNPALEQARRTADATLGDMQKNQLQGSARQAAQMGAVPGSTAAKKLAYEGNAQIQQAGSGMLGQLTQRGLDDAKAGLTGLTGFHEGQQKNKISEGSLANDSARVGISRDSLNESTRQFDTKHKSDEDQRTIQNLESIINNPLSSVGQVNAAKGKLGQMSGFDTSDPSGWGAKEKTKGENAVQDMTDDLIASGMDPAQAAAEAKKRFGSLTDAEYKSLMAQYDSELGKPAGTSEGQSVLDRFGNVVGGTLQANYAGHLGAASGAGHAVMETGRGLRDIGRGDIIGGTGRVIAAPVKGATHAVMETGRNLKKGGKKILKAIGF